MQGTGHTVSRKVGGLLGVLATLGLVGTAVAHEFKHAPPSRTQPAPLSEAVIAGGEDVSWELLATLPTGNPQTDLDFWTRGGETYMSVGSLAVGPNAAGQNIFKLTDGAEVKPTYVTGHPSATCPKATSSATGLQHDSEAAPKGQALPQFPNPYIDTSDTELVIDATDATGRCHDQGPLGVSQAGAPPGGLEIIDVTDPTKPKEIGLTTHVGMAHTVNVDPKRPHIAYVSSSDQVLMDSKGQRTNEYFPCAVSVPDGAPCPQQSSTAPSTMDGIEVVDLSTCMNFPPGTSDGTKRDLCAPRVFRYRWPDVNMARSHTYQKATGACHELEIYPDDRLVCAGLMATTVLDMKGAFDDNGTPTDFTDDKPRGTPLPCNRRASSTPSQEPWTTDAKVTDCVTGVKPDGSSGQGLQVKPWIEIGAPSLEGVTWLGTFHHMGFENQQRENFAAKYDSTKDIYVAHEAEFTQSRDYVLTTDERGGGVLPGGASCTPGGDNVRGNGGIHAFRVDRLGTAFPADNDDARAAYQERVYAKDSKGNRAIFRAPVHTEPQGSVCTSHVFEQIPGQNRIFMAWYSQGTQVIDFTENADGTIDFKSRGYFIPANANEWVSHIFKVQENPDGTFTYWGATGDFALGDAGRNAVDVYKVTMPPPPKPRGAAPAGTPTFPLSETKGVPVGAPAPACASTAGFNFVRATPRRGGKRIRFSFSRRSANGVTVTVIRKSRGRTVVGRRIKTFKNRTKAFTWAARRTRDGYYQARFRTRAPNGKTDVRHLGLRKRNGRWRAIGAFDRRETCDLVKYTRLRSPVFGGTDRRPLPVVFRLSQSAKVSIVVSRKGKVVKRIKARNYERATKNTVVIRLGRKARRGLHAVRLKAVAPGRTTELTLYSRYL